MHLRVYISQFWHYVIRNCTFYFRILIKSQNYKFISRNSDFSQNSQRKKVAITFYFNSVVEMGFHKMELKLKIHKTAFFKLEKQIEKAF